MAVSFSIRTVAEITGLTPECLRSWEARYNVVEPERTQTGRRSYNSAQVSRLQLLSTAVGQGETISQIVDMSDEDLESLIQNTSAIVSNPDTGKLIERLLGHVKELDIKACDSALSSALINLDPWQAVENVITPVLHRVGDLWQKGALEIGEEHLISSLIKMRLYAAIQTMPHAQNAPSVLLTTLGGEQHEIGAIAACYLARASGARSEYLGADMPAKDIISITERLDCAVLGISLTTPSNLQDAITTVTGISDQISSDIEIWLGGAYANDVGSAVQSKTCIVINDHVHLRAELARLLH